jgi:hypothetical protein
MTDLFSRGKCMGRAYTADSSFPKPFFSLQKAKQPQNHGEERPQGIHLYYTNFTIHLLKKSPLCLVVIFIFFLIWHDHVCAMHNA